MLWSWPDLSLGTTWLAMVKLQKSRAPGTRHLHVQVWDRHKLLLTWMVSLHKRDACAQGRQDPTSLSWMLAAYVLRRSWAAYLTLKIWFGTSRCLAVWLRSSQCIKIESFAKPKSYLRSVITPRWMWGCTKPSENKAAAVFNVKETSSGGSGKERH